MIEICERIDPGDVIAVGDIHATWGPYRQFLDWAEGSQAVVVLLGDLIDRGGEDLVVLEATRQRLEDPEKFGLGNFHVLKGNHEEMFLTAAFDGIAPFRTSTLVWLENGGNFRDKFEMIDNHSGWLWRLPVYMTIGDTLFIHGGIFPGKDPAVTVEERGSDPLLWMREPFLRFGPEFEKWNPRLKKVVHGHTPTIFEEGCYDLEFTPVIKNDRTNIDTGAWYQGQPKGFLTAYNVTQNTFKFFHK